MVGVVIRAMTYATLFVSAVLVYLPAQTLSWTGVRGPERLGLPQVAGIIATACGAALAVWCILNFAIIGRGTPAPFDPPRRLVVRGPALSAISAVKRGLERRRLTAERAEHAEPKNKPSALSAISAVKRGLERRRLTAERAEHAEPKKQTLCALCDLCG